MFYTIDSTQWDYSLSYVGSSLLLTSLLSAIENILFISVKAKHRQVHRSHPPELGVASTVRDFEQAVAGLSLNADAFLFIRLS